MLVLHLALVPVNLWRLNQAFRPGTRSQNGPHTPQALPQQRSARQPSGWTAARRGARMHRCQAGSATLPQGANVEREPALCREVYPALARQAVEAPRSRSAR